MTAPSRIIMIVPRAMWGFHFCSERLIKSCPPVEEPCRKISAYPIPHRTPVQTAARIRSPV